MNTPNLLSSLLFVALVVALPPSALGQDTEGGDWDGDVTTHQLDRSLGEEGWELIEGPTVRVVRGVDEQLWVAEREVDRKRAVIRLARFGDAAEAREAVAPGGRYFAASALAGGRSVLLVEVEGEPSLERHLIEVLESGAAIEPTPEKWDPRVVGHQFFGGMLGAAAGLTPFLLVLAIDPSTNDSFEVAAGATVALIPFTTAIAVNWTGDALGANGSVWFTTLCSVLGYGLGGLATYTWLENVNHEPEAGMFVPFGLLLGSVVGYQLSID